MNKLLPVRLDDTAGPLVEYLKNMEKQGPEMVEKVRAVKEAVRAVLSTDDGAILLDLLEKSTLLFVLHPNSDPRALDALNAQRMIPLDLRRIAAYEPTPAQQRNGTRPARGKRT